MKITATHGEWGEKNAEKHGEKRTNAFRAMAPVMAFAAFFGCGRSALNVPGRDAAPQDDTKTCGYVQSPPLNCSSVSENRLVNKGETTFFDSNGITLDGVERKGDANVAVISIVDGECRTVDRQKISEGETKVILASNIDYIVSADSVSGADGAIWAKFKVRPPGCTADAGPKADAGVADSGTSVETGQVDAGAPFDSGSQDAGADAYKCHNSPGPVLACGNTTRSDGGAVNTTAGIGGIVNVGEAIPADAFTFRLDGVEIAGESVSAIISISDINCNYVKKDKIPQGTTKEYALGGKTYAVKMNSIAAGPTADSQWADMEVTLAGCEADAGVADAGSAPDTAPGCSISPGPKLYCDADAGATSMQAVLNQGERLSAMGYAIQLDDLEMHGESVSAIISILDQNCNILKKDKVAPGVTKEFNINGETFNLTVNQAAAGYTFSTRWADITVSAAGCPDKCEPSASCGAGYDATVVTLGEGESKTFPNPAGSIVTVKIGSIAIGLGVPSEGTCPVVMEKVELALQTPKSDDVQILLEGGCFRSYDGCYTAKVLEINEDIGVVGDNAYCEASNKKARLEILTPKQ